MIKIVNKLISLQIQGIIILRKAILKASPIPLNLEAPLQCSIIKRCSKNIQ